MIFLHYIDKHSKYFWSKFKPKHTKHMSIKQVDIYYFDRSRYEVPVLLM